MNRQNRAAEARLLPKVSLLMISLLLLALAACGGDPVGNNGAAAENDMTNDAMDDGMMDEDMSGEEAMEDDLMNEVGSGDELSNDDMMDEDMSGDDMSNDEDMLDEDMSGDDAMDDDMMGDELSSDEDMEEPMDDDMSGDVDGEAMVDRPAWQELPLVNARTGETFTLAGFHGQRLFVEPMATWCTQCRQQLQNVQLAQETAPDDAVFIALSVETNLSADQLAAYADTHGFDWHFAVMTPEMLQALVDELGRPIANPPSTPHFVIASDGTWTDLVTGIDTPDALIAQIESVQ